ncbi:restriction endonuclease subunit S [Mesoflavibacter zeaxanthinifaciens]|uniref:restriction endonuclease subunit S n=1 Tax=Mesoflavibacter zeaxanthinifaciens TaxID=393060 RepID=UPI003A94E0D6
MMEGWKQIKLGDIIHIKHGYGFKGEYFVEEPNNNILVTPGNFAIGGGFKDDKMKYYDGPINEEFVLSEGDVIVTMTDLSKQADTLGYSAKVPKDDINTYLHNQRIGLVSLLSKDYDLDFIYWLLRTHAYQRYIAGSSSGATVKHTSPKKIYSTKLTVPKSKETQRKIASILSAYDDLIENNLKRIKLLEEQAQLTYEEWFVRFKFPGHETTKFDEETGLPEGWERKKLGELVLLQQGFALNKKSKHHVSEKKTDFPLLKIGDLLNGTETLFVKETIPKQFLVDKDEIIYSRTGQVGLAFMGRKGVIYNNCFRVSANENIDKLVLYYFLISEPIKETAKSLATGSAQPDLNHGAFKSIPIDLPPKNIQKQYSLPIEKNLKIIENLTIQNQHLKEARDILLPRLMSGMIDPSTSSGQVVEKLEVGSLKYEVNDSLGMVAEENDIYSK